MKGFAIAVLKPLRLRLLKIAVGIVERAGLSVVQIKRTDNAIYVVGSSGSYVRFDKVKA